MANHRATGRAQTRPLAISARASHRDSAAVSAGILKVGVLGALATATIAVPLASATAGQPGAGASALPASISADARPVAHTQSVAARPVALPVAAVDGAATTSYADSAVTSNLSAAAAAGADEATLEDIVASGDGYMKPVDAPISSGYGWRVHPTLGTRKLHDGVDFAAACGTPARAAQAGTVIAVEHNSSSGNRVKVDHGNGVVTGYYHLSEFSVSVGDHVTKGQTVGLVGSTGRSTGCHLHFAKMDAQGAYSDPMSLFR